MPGVWQTFELAGHPCDWFEPAELNPHGYAVIYLHGVHLQRLVDQPAFSQEFDRHGLRCLAPMTGPTWWTDRVSSAFDSRFSPERYLLDQVLAWIRDEWQTQPPRIGLLGTSMGGQGALRLAFKHPNTFPVVAGISPAIDYQWRMREGDEVLYELYPDEEAARQDTATLHVHPLNWPRNIWFGCDPADLRWHESAERLRTKLYALGIPHQVDLETTGGGHGFGYYSRMAPAAIGFLAQRLEQERMRVP